MRLSGGQSLADGLTAATPLFSSLGEENANESRHSDHKSRKSVCSLGFYLLLVRLEQSNATRTSVAAASSMAANLYLRLSAQMQMSLVTRFVF